jgi:ribonuclease Z
MTSRELIVLGSASQVPTRHRNHNGYFLRWDNEGILFDPGEGTQRQMTFTGVSASAITRICITHLHGDHCLGLPGVIQRLSLDRVDHAIDLYYPASGQEFIDRLRTASIFYDTTQIRCHPVNEDGVLESSSTSPTFDLVARALDHGVDSIGYQLVEHDGRTILPALLAKHGVAGAKIGELQKVGHVNLDATETTIGGRVNLADVSEVKQGQRFAFVMDTRVCVNAISLAERADLLVCESTFAADDEDLATSHGHLTSKQAGSIALESNARKLLITHFSQRYVDTSVLLAETQEVFPNTDAAHDLLHVPVPNRL